MKKLLPTLAALLVAPLLGSDSPRGYDGAAVVTDEELQGAWERVKLERNGHLMMAPRNDQAFRGRVWQENNGSTRRTGTYTADPTRSPRTLDIVHPDDPPGTTRRYIYQVHGDTLRVAFTWPSYERPVGFSDADDQVGLNVATYKRIKK